jgi:pSer/pThr/pTyr-binding forkhead associated (FHA) protein
MQIEIRLEGKPNHWTYNQRLIRVGRDSSCDIALPSADYSTVSREHARLEVINGEVHVTDNRSSNGTYVNGARVTSVVLQSGDCIRLGSNGPSLVVGFAAPAASHTVLDATVLDPTMLAPTVPGVEAQPPVPAPPPVELSTLVAEETCTQVASAESCAQSASNAKPGHVTEVTVAGETVVAASSEYPPETQLGAAKTLAPQIGSLAAAAAPARAATAPRPATAPATRVAVAIAPPTPIQESVPSVATPSPNPLPGDFAVNERKLDQLRTLLTVNIVLLVLLFVGFLYQLQQISRTREQVMVLQQQAATATQQLEPELDRRLKKFETRIDNFDAQSKMVENRFVDRMNTEIPSMLDRYVQTKLKDAQKLHLGGQ